MITKREGSLPPSLPQYLAVTGAVLAAGGLAEEASAAPIIMDLSGVPIADRTLVRGESALGFDLDATTPAGAVGHFVSAGTEGVFQAPPQTSTGDSYTTFQYLYSSSGNHTAIAADMKGAIDYGSGVLIDDTLAYSNTLRTGVAGTGPHNFTAGETGFIGVRFQISGENHYGWLNITINNDSGLTVNSVAYNDAPGEGILTSVPEPSSLALVAGGAAGLLAWRRRRSRS